VLVVVPALVSTVQSLTGAVDDEREKAQQTAETLAGELSRAGLQARGVVGADDTVLAIEDALREFGADEIVLAMGDEALLAKAHERFGTARLPALEHHPVADERHAEAEVLGLGRPICVPALALVETPGARVVLEHPEDLRRRPRGPASRRARRA